MERRFTESHFDTDQYIGRENYYSGCSSCSSSFAGEKEESIIENGGACNENPLKSHSTDILEKTQKLINSKESPLSEPKTKCNSCLWCKKDLIIVFLLVATILFVLFRKIK